MFFLILRHGHNFHPIYVRGMKPPFTTRLNEADMSPSNRGKDMGLEPLSYDSMNNRASHFLYTRPCTVALHSWVVAVFTREKAHLKSQLQGGVFPQASTN